MNIQYKCCFCGNDYDWYEGIYENPDYNHSAERKARRNGTEYSINSGTYINANGFILTCIDPINDMADADAAVTTTNVNGNLNVYINICPDCMRKILDNVHPSGNENAWETV